MANTEDNQERQPDVADYGRLAQSAASGDLKNRFQNFAQGFDNKASSVATDTAQQAGKEAAKDVAKEAGKEAGKEAAKQTATKAAASAATASGVGAPAGAAIEVASAVKRGIDNFSEDTFGTSVQFKDILLFLVGFFVLVLVLGAGSVHGNIGSTSEKYSEDQTNETFVNKNTKGFRFIQKLIQKRYIDELSDGEGVGEWDAQYPLKESLDKNLAIINKAFDTAYKIAEEEEIVEIILERDYDYALTMESFYGNGNPFEDVNYAEFISLISQKDTYNIENVKYSVYKKLLKANKKNENLRYLYKMKVEDDYATVRFYNDDSGQEIRLAAGASPPTKEDGTSYEVEEKEVLYGKVTLRHYDLKSLYEMLELEPNEKNAHWEANNIDILDCQEKYIRFFARDYNLGPEERTVWNWGFDREKISLSLEDYEELIGKYKDLLESGELDGDAEQRLQTLLQFAFSKLGTKYSQAYRNQDGYYDCSSFVSSCFQQIGIEFGSYSPTAAEMCRYCEGSGYQVSSGYRDSLKPGDILFYSSRSNGRYKNVTHVALYIGNGKIIDASSSKGQVVYRNIWGKNQIVSVCRPLR